MRAIVVPHMESSMFYKIGLSKLASDPVKLEKAITSSKQYATVLNYSVSTAGLKDFPAASNQISEKSQRQGINQQGINKSTDSVTSRVLNQLGVKQFRLKWFIGFSEGDGSFVITGGKTIFSIHLHIADLPLLYEIQAQLNMGNVYLNKNSAAPLFSPVRFSPNRASAHFSIGKIIFIVKAKKYRAPPGRGSYLMRVIFIYANVKYSLKIEF